MLNSRQVPVCQRLDEAGAVQLGVAFAGARISVCELAHGVWEIRLVPDGEAWLQRPESLFALTRAASWALEHGPAETDLDELFSLASRREPGPG